MYDLLLVASITWIAALFLQCWRLLLYFQQEEYEARRFLRWAGQRVRQLIPARLLMAWALGSTASLVLALLVPSASFPVLVLGWLSGGIAAGLLVNEIRRPAKIRLAYTLRIDRLLVVLAAICVAAGFLAALGLALAAPALAPAGAFSLELLLYGLLLLAAPVWIVLANLLLFPVEKLIQRYYLGAAGRKLRKIHPTVVGITGSYGKTSTKEFLAHILAGFKPVLATPKSYNTLLGVSRVINSSLKPEHEIFIVEMGAYIPGEIERICRLVRPDVGTITAIGPQHLERFGSLENVARAKFELIRAVPETGVAVFSADDTFTQRFRDQAGSRKVLTVTTLEDTCADLAAEDIQAGPGGLDFTLVDRRTGERVPCNVQLLGRHNINNILIAATIAQELGMSLAAISARIARLSPVPHRLQLIDRGNGVLVIDDAYNSNPVGARNALETLGFFRQGRRILITPGLIELGPLERQANFELGQEAARVCDRVVLVGPVRTVPIREGLESAGFPKEQIEVVADLQDSIQLLDRLVQPLDTVLFLNDLPDLYSENI